MQFNFNSSRSRKARFRRVIQKKAIRIILIIILIFVTTGWIWAIFITSNLLLGTLTAIVASPVFMVLIWWNLHLKNLPINSELKSIDDMLEPDLLGLLTADLDFTKLIKVLKNTDGARFFGSRFAISVDFIAKISENMNLETVWISAVDYSRRHNEPYVTSASVLVAILLINPDTEYYLNQLKLDKEDIISGLGWHSHIKNVIDKASKEQSRGGIGRDLSFGYTPLLSRLGLNITQSVENSGLLHRNIEGHGDIISQMIHLLSQQGRRNATLVGNVGSGKTTLVYALAQMLLMDTRVPQEIKYQQIIALDSATLIANSKGQGQLEELLIRLLNEASKAKNIILFLDEAQLFLRDGVGSVDLSRILQPVLEGGGIKLILALDEQEWLRLGQQAPSLVQLLNRVAVSPLSKEDTLKVLEDQVLLLEFQHNVTYMYQSLEEAYNLAERFVQDQVFPGKAVKLLESATGFKEQEYFITAKSVQMAVEKTQGVKVQVASNQDEKTILLNLEEKIHERMVNQSRAVQVVCDALRRARTGVRNQNKPIGTFLFLGPTGVGKTELSKALASTYFEGEENLIRVDLNEYSQADSVNRLISSPVNFASSLTAQIVKNPFSVVLLDEIEKAHPNVLDILLQMLDEGILRDQDNNEVSFKDSIIIATSNAGADEIRRHIDSGENLEQFEEGLIDELINKQVFRPEFINRFDEVVLFRPLTQVELIQVVDLILKGINGNLASQKISALLTQSAKEVLSEAGYDPRLGARPLRRVMQRTIENIIANKLLTNQVSAGSQLTIDAPEIISLIQKN